MGGIDNKHAKPENQGWVFDTPSLHMSTFTTRVEPNPITTQDTTSRLRIREANALVSLLHFQGSQADCFIFLPVAV